MENDLRSRLKRGWNAFLNRDPTEYENYSSEVGMTYSYMRPDRPIFTKGNDRNIVSAIYDRFAIDVSSIDIKHCKIDENGRLISVIDSGLNECLTVEANIDQTGRDLIKDIVVSMLDEGEVAVVPVDTTVSPLISGGYDINSLRTGKILEWRPYHVKVRVYNERIGKKEEIILPKSMVSIIPNPLYEIMNEPNSTLQRLKNKLNQLDRIDDQNSSGKMNLIIQLPYIVKTDARRKQAEERRKEVEMQLAGSKYGIAYIDGTEHVTQLNRPIDNNILDEIKDLRADLFSQIGISQTILDGTADEKTMLNYYNRIIEPILVAITEEMNRKFLTKTARTQKQSILFFQDPFKLVPVNQIAEIADKFTRNEIMTSNEIRQIIGLRPSKDPEADELRNKNLNKSAEEEKSFNANLNNEENFQNGEV